MFWNGKLKAKITELEVTVQFQDRKIRQLKATDYRMKKEIRTLKKKDYHAEQNRLIGTTRGRKERITINIDPVNHAWLEEQSLSYSKIINRLLHEKADKGDT